MLVRFMDDGTEWRVGESSCFGSEAVVCFDPDGCDLLFNRHAAFVEQVMINLIWISIDFVDLFQIGVVHCMRPAQVLVESGRQNGTTDEC